MVSSSGVSRSRTSIINRDMYMENGDFIKDIEVNDLRDRYTLTKGETQKMVNILVILAIIPKHLCPESVPDSCGYCYSFWLFGRVSETYNLLPYHVSHFIGIC